MKAGTKLPDIAKEEESKTQDLHPVNPIKRTCQLTATDLALFQASLRPDNKKKYAAPRTKKMAHTFFSPTSLEPQNSVKSPNIDPSKALDLQSPFPPPISRRSEEIKNHKIDEKKGNKTHDCPFTFGF